MTLREMAAEYRRNAAIIKTRIILLQNLRRESRDANERQALLARIDTLTRLYRESRSIALHMERYYRREGRTIHGQKTESTDASAKQ